MPSSEAQAVRCHGCRAECSTLKRSSLGSATACHGKAGVCQGVKMLSPNIFSATGTDGMDAYLTGGVDRPAAALLESPPPPPRLHRHHLQLHRHRSNKHNHQNNRHQLAPQQQCLGQGWKEIRTTRRPCSGSTSRRFGRRPRRKTSASGRLPSRNQQCGEFFTYNRADLAARKRKHISSRREIIHQLSRPANFLCPQFTVQLRFHFFPRRTSIICPSRPVTIFKPCCDKPWLFSLGS